MWSFIAGVGGVVLVLLVAQLAIWVWRQHVAIRAHQAELEANRERLDALAEVVELRESWVELVELAGTEERQRRPDLRAVKPPILILGCWRVASWLRERPAVGAVTGVALVVGMAVSMLWPSHDDDGPKREVDVPAPQLPDSTSEDSAGDDGDDEAVESGGDGSSHGALEPLAAGSPVGLDGGDLATGGSPGLGAESTEPEVDPDPPGVGSTTTTTVVSTTTTSTTTTTTTTSTTVPPQMDKPRECFIGLSVELLELLGLEVCL